MSAPVLPETIRLLACPSCRASLAFDEAGGRCLGCSAAFRLENGVLDLRRPADARTERVRSFYTTAPFPNYPPEETIFSLRSRAARSEFARLLDQAIPGDARVVEIGCGTGQMSLFLATADRVVVGADLTRASLELAADAARRFGVRRVSFVETDLRHPGLQDGAFDVVYSSGVLHHTPDPAASFSRVSRLLRPGGVIVLGLYNLYARLPHRLRRVVARLSGLRFIPFDPILSARESEPARREAWLRDQYIHPEEHQHTLREVQGWFADNSIRYLRCFPNTQFGAEPLSGAGLFSSTSDDWGFENVISQVAWGGSLGAEGGLWVTIGVKEG